MSSFLRPLLLFLFLLPAMAATAQVNFSSGLVAYYPFNGTFNDASGNGNNGTAMNGAAFGTDQWGNANNAASFDGVDDYVAIPASAGITPSHNLSIAFRFKTSSSALQILLSKSDWTGTSAPNNFQYQIGINGGSLLPSNGLFFATAHTGNSCIKSQFLADHYSYGSNTASGTWYCVVLTFNNGVKKIYMNGVLAGTSTVTGTPNNSYIDSCAGGQLRLGVWWQKDPRWFSGLMDELRLYNRVLNQQEIDSFCNLKVSPELVINQYAAITARSTDCDNSFTVDDATGFRAGDTVLMIQMKGATIDTSNTASFGSVLNYNGAGNYEFNTIKSVSGNTITLFYQVKRNYDIPGGLVQFVRVPYFPSYTVSQPHTCMPWNGTKGGVFAINVAGTLTLNDNIDVSGKGFGGGVSNPVYRGTYLCNITHFYDPPNADSSAQKGEGITTVSISKTFARGSLANGGGGGNAANSGGGGGGNGGAGGIGGAQFVGCTTNPPTNIIAGLGGLAQTYNTSLNKVFMGGGGGAGQANEQVNSNGGTGGGIVFIGAGSITGSAHSIKADGADAPECNGPTTQCTDDGTGGGGGGGALLISAGSLSSSVSLSATGGKGADIYLIPAFVNTSGYHGPGGGGGGGVVWVSPSIAAALSAANVAGGLNGVHPQLGNNPHGAAPGAAGKTLNTLTIVAPTDTFKTGGGSLDFSYKVISCNTAQFTALPANAFYSSYLWTFPGGATSTLAGPTYTFPGPGSYQVTLTVKDANGCTLTVTKEVVITPYTGTRRDTSLCGGGAVQLSTYQGALSYSWTPPTGLSSTTIYNPIASPSSTTMYVVTVDAGQGCVFQDTIVVHVSPAVKANFDFKPRPPVPNTPIQFYNLSTGASAYAWSFGDGMGSSEKDPSHLYLKTGSYRVCLVASNEACLDSVCKMVDAEVRLAIAVPSAFSPNGDGANDVLFARGGGVQSFTLKVFNRWGQVVFETHDLAKGWDGTFKGQPQEIETYAYVLTATFIDGSTYQKSGNISLVR